MELTDLCFAHAALSLKSRKVSEMPRCCVVGSQGAARARGSLRRCESQSRPIAQAASRRRPSHGTTAQVCPAPVPSSDALGQSWRAGGQGRAKGALPLPGAANTRIGPSWVAAVGIYAARPSPSLYGPVCSQVGLVSAQPTRSRRRAQGVYAQVPGAAFVCLPQGMYSVPAVHEVGLPVKKAEPAHKRPKRLCRAPRRYARPEMAAEQAGRVPGRPARKWAEANWLVTE